jgi:hypothetical protein
MAHAQKPDLCVSAKRPSPFKSAGASVRSTTGSRGVRISGSNAGYTMFRGSVKGTGYRSIRHFPLHFPSRASPCAITFQLDSTSNASLPFLFVPINHLKAKRRPKTQSVPRSKHFTSRLLKTNQFLL